MKTIAQRKILWKHRKVPFFWTVINDFENRMTVMNWITGSFRVLDK